MNKSTKKHFGDISRLVGHDVSNRYSYIIDEKDLTNAWLQFHNDLGYPLMIDSKYRRAIVYNKSGLERKIQQMIMEVMEENGKILADMIANDITNQLNNLTDTANGKLTTTKSNRSFYLANAISKGLVKGFFKVLDDIIIPDDDYKR